jgi:parallel beta-helix repeat protein
MKSFQPLSSFALVAAGLAAAWTATADAEAKPATAEIAFSKDEKSVTINYAAKEWKLQRPVVSPWDYEKAGDVYWVSPDGKDKNVGSEEKTYQTIRRALSQASAGDVVYVKAGTYVEDLLVTRSGEEKRPIVLSCAPGDLGKVVVTVSKEYVEKNPQGAVVSVKGAENVWINGLVLEGPKGRPEAPTKLDSYGANGITWMGEAGKGCRATNNVIYKNLHCGLKEMHHGGAGILIEGNIIFDNGLETRDHGIYAPSDDHIINGNIVFNNAGYGVHAYEKPKKLTIARNIFFGNKEGGVILAGSDCKVFNNVCVDNGRGVLYFRGGCTKKHRQKQHLLQEQNRLRLRQRRRQARRPRRQRRRFQLLLPRQTESFDQAGDQ